jgi:hypothetical protein
MKLYGVVRNHEGVQTVLHGGGLNGKPLWEEPGGEAVSRPMLFRSEDYAKWNRDIAKRCDREHANSPGQYECTEYGIYAVQFFV